MRRLLFGIAYFLLSTGLPPVHAQNLSSVETLEIVDAVGVRVGKMQDTLGGVILDVDGRVFRVQASVNSLSFGSELYNPSPDCSGTPFMQRFSDILIEFPAFLPPTGIVYLPDLIALPQALEVQSVENSIGCRPITDPPFPVLNLVPAVIVVDLSTIFTPPFMVQPQKTGKSGK